MKALVIDDSKAMRVILGGYLRRMGFDVGEAEHGRDGLDQLQRGKLDVVLVDWNMPIMNGLDFIKAVRANPFLRKLRVLVVTSEAEITQMTHAISAGADEYLMKPFTHDSLARKLEILGVTAGVS